MGTNYIAPIWRMPRNANKDKLSNYSVEFNGSSQAINCGNGSDVDITGPISISVWFNATTVGNARGIVCKNNAAAQQTFAQYFFDLLSGEIRWRAGASTVTHAINADQWYHAVGTYNGSNTTLYIDGTQVATAAASASSFQSVEPMYIGRRLNQAYFGGKIAQVCIFDYALTDGTGGTTNQIEYLYNLNNPMVITGGEPVAYYPLGDNSNPNANAGYPNVSVGADSVFDFVPNDYINLGEDVVPATPAWTSLTVSGWIKKDETGNYGRVIGKDDGGSNRVFLLQVQNNDKLSGSIRVASGSAWDNVQTSTNVAIGEWQHVAMTFEGDQAIKLFINGQEEANDSTVVPSVLNKTTNTLIGAKGSGNPSSTPTNVFDGQISNVQIWDVALTNAEMLQVYNNGQPLMTGTQPQEANLKAWYKLNQSANWEADTANNWQIPDNRSAYPQSFIFKQNEIIRTPNNVFDGIVTDSNKIGICTISYWLKNKNTGAQQDYMSLNDAGPGLTNSAYFRIDSNNKILYHNGSNYMRWPAPPDLDGWNHYCWVFNSATSYSTPIGQTNGDLEFYLNGEIQAVDWNNAAAPAGEPWNGFNIAEAGQASGNGLDFCMSNLMLYNTNFDSAKVLQLYNNGVPLTTAIEPNNLVTWLKLDNTAVWYANSGQWGIPNAGSTNTQIINFSN